MACSAPTRIVMLGTSVETRGGIASVVKAYRAGGLFARWPIEYIATHCDGTRGAKWVCAVSAFFSMLAAIARHPCALLHVHGASRASFWRKAVLMALARLAGWPIVFHLHGGGFARFYERECGAVARRVIRYFLDHAAAIVVVSERWEEWMKTVTRNENVTVIRNPVALPGPSPRPSPKGEGEPLVAFVGRCEEGKGVFDLLEAVNALRASVPDVQLECAGSGELDALRARAAELGMAGHLRLPGWIGRQRRDELLARATVFVLPSHAEGMPMGLLEAMAAGCPVVASAVGGIPDIVAHGENGLLVTPGDRASLAVALHRVMADRDLATRLGRAARATIARDYTIERSLERLEHLYAGLGVAQQRAHEPADPLRRLQETP